MFAIFSRALDHNLDLSVEFNRIRVARPDAQDNLADLAGFSSPPCRMANYRPAWAVAPVFPGDTHSRFPDMVGFKGPPIFS